MPTPSAWMRSTLSKTLTGMPARFRLNAVVNPPIPPPAMMTSCTVSVCRSRHCVYASHSLSPMTRPLLVGVQLPEVEWEVPFPELIRMAQTAEQVGFDSVWLGDPLLYDLALRPPGP